MPARKGDGTGLAFNGFSEARKGDGTVLWTSGPDVTIVDSFEDGDIAEYGAGNASKGGFSVVNNSSEAVDGDDYLVHDSAVFSQMSSTSGLNAYPSQGDIFAFNVHFRGTDANNHIRVGWAAVDESYSDQYYLELSTNANQFAIKRGGNNVSNYTIASATENWSGYLSQWLECEVQWQSDGTMTATVWESTDRNTQIHQISGTDTNLGDGGISFGGGEGYRADWYRITGTI